MIELKRLTATERRYARRVATFLDKQHKNDVSNTKLENSTDQNYIGTCGEICFFNWTGDGYQFVNSRKGDGHVDLVYMGMTVDVKTIVIGKYEVAEDAISRLNLLVKEGQVVSDMFVTVLYRDDGWVALHGSAIKEAVLAVAPRKFPQHISNHAIPLSELIPFGDAE